MQKTRKATQIIQVAVLLSIIVAIQFYAAMLNTTRAVYVGIQFGTEAQVSSDGMNDIWQLEKVRYTYIANNQTKPEVDLVGLHIQRNADALTSHSDFEIVSLQSSDNKINYNHSYSFNVPVTDVINVSYTFITNQTYSASALEVYNWAVDQFQNQSLVMNQSKVLLSDDYYETQQILIHFNITYSQEFGFWYNLTFELWYIAADQVISLQFASLTQGNASLVDHLQAWIFLDVDGDDKLNYAIHWIYENKTFLYQIKNNSFTLGGAWNGVFGKYWTGMSWVSKGISQQNLGSIDAITKMVNVTIPDFAVNLTTAVRYAVWAQKIETNYDWWDALPDDPYWELSVPIPGFQWLLLGLSLVLIGVIFLRKVVIKLKQM